MSYPSDNPYCQRPEYHILMADPATGYAFDQYGEPCPDVEPDWPKIIANMDAAATSIQACADAFAACVAALANLLSLAEAMAKEMEKSANLPPET